MTKKRKLFCRHWDVYTQEKQKVIITKREREREKKKRGVQWSVHVLMFSK